MKILFFASGDHLYHFRLPLAAAALAQGHEVLLASPPDPYAGKLTAAGFRWCSLPLERGGVNPFKELITLLRVARIYRRERPDLVHHFTLKCALYGSLAARSAGIRAVLNAVPGVGYLYTSKHLKAKLLRPFVNLLCRVGFRGTRMIFENPDNRELFLACGITSKGESCVIRSAGVDTDRFTPSPEVCGTPVVLLAGRMLWDKGIAEFVEAVNLLKRQGVIARFVLVGACDPENPAAVPRRSLEEWSKTDVVEWWGPSEDMPAVFAKAHVVCLPSYGEGGANVLLEAGACGRPVVATDVPGCRQAVRHGESGLLVPVRDPGALAEAIATLLKDPDLRARMGARGREIAVQEFSDKKVVQETLAVYRDLLGERWTTPAGEDPESKR